MIALDTETTKPRGRPRIYSHPLCKYCSRRRAVGVLCEKHAREGFVVPEPVGLLWGYEDKNGFTPESVDTRIDSQEIITFLMECLSWREREIIRLRYGLGDGYSYTLEEVGHIFKVTRERVRSVEAKAMWKMSKRARVRGEND